MLILNFMYGFKSDLGKPNEISLKSYLSIPDYFTHLRLSVYHITLTKGLLKRFEKDFLLGIIS